MQLKPSRFRAAVLPAVLLGGLASPSLAVEVTDRDASYEFRYFTDSDRVHVGSHFVRAGLGFTGGSELRLRMNHERVVIPAVGYRAGTPEAVDAITTASRPISGGGAFRDFRKVRNEVEADLTTPRAAAGYYLSTESDYLAQMVKAEVNRDFFRRNLNLAAGSSYGWDAIEPLEDDDTAGGNASRTTWHGHLVATQTLTPTMELRVGAELNLVRGLQHNPYRNVYAGGAPRPERHPDRRERRDLFVKLSRYFRSRSSLKVDYRYYTDDWGVRSHTVGGTLDQYVTGNAVVQYRYRFYTQGAADFFRPEYADADGIDGCRSGDYRLDDFDSHLFGARLRLNLGAFRDAQKVLRRLDLTLQYERYFNTNNFSANIFESGLAYRF